MTTSTPTFLDIWHELLPTSVRIIAGPITPAPAGRSSLADLSPDRRNEYFTGRLYASKALACFGVENADLTAADDGRPVWPTGYVGSITHTRQGARGLCTAAVACTADWNAIGIDSEFSQAIAPAIWPAILTEDELKQIKTLPPNERTTEVTRRWCAKEAAIKAMNLILEPLALETRASGSGQYAFLRRRGRADEL